MTGCASRLEGAFAGAAGNVVVDGRTGDEAAAVRRTATSARSAASTPSTASTGARLREIQDGCSFACAFCVIPLVRGATRSRTAAAVLAEIRRRVDQGHREIVLTGVNLGCFRDREAGYTLPRLVREAGAVPGLERLRLSSIEVNHVDARARRGRCARRRRSRGTCTCRCSPATTASCARWAAATRSTRTSRRLEPLAGRQPDDRRDRRVPGRGRAGVRAHARDGRSALGLTKVHVFPYSPRPGTRTAADDPCRPP